MTWKEKYCYDVTRFDRNDEYAGYCHHLFHRMTVVCRQRDICRKICPRDQSLRQVRDQCENEPTTAVHTASITGSDPQMTASSETPIPISSDALSEDVMSLKACVLSNRRAFMGRIMISAKDKRLLKMKTFEDPKTEKSVRTQIVRDWVVRVCIFDTCHNRESHECSKINVMRIRWSTWAMEVLMEITLEEPEMCCRGNEIIPATQFPAETSSRILTRIRHYVTSLLGTNFVSNIESRRSN